MASFRETREALLLAHDQALIDDNKFALLYDVNTSKNLDFPYWHYQKFDLDVWSDEECLSEFRFYKADVYRLYRVLQIPAQIQTYNRSLVDGLESFCIFFKRFAYPCR